MKAYRITVRGLVQGVGFRPFIRELAERDHISGNVRNSGGIVIIDAFADEDRIRSFVGDVRTEAPAGSMISGIEIRQIHSGRREQDRAEEAGAALFRGKQARENFVILPSSRSEDEVRILPPDITVCPDCVREMRDPANRRYRYPFISCKSCGPRFSIMKAVPYDRETTTMDIFPMCDSCRAEYTTLSDRRHYAQTVSCHDCGPELIYTPSGAAAAEAFEDKPAFCSAGDADKPAFCSAEDADKPAVCSGEEADKPAVCSGEEALKTAVADLKTGKVGAVLDIGGFHFAFRADSREAAARLRKAEAKAKAETITEEQYRDIRDAVEGLNRVLENNGETGYHMEN